MNKYMVLLLLCVLGVVNCKETSVSDKRTVDLGHFDGSCSVCIADFIEATMKFAEQEKNWNYPVTFVVETTDPIVFQSNIKQFSIKNTNVIVDTTYYISSHNISF